MSCGGAFSAVMSIAGAGLIPGAAAIPGVGAALGPASALTSSLGSFTSLPITGQFSDIVTSATGALGGGTLDSLRTLGSGIMPSLTNAIPSDFASSLSTLTGGATGVFDGGFSGLVGTTASQLMGGGDLSMFSQVFNSAEGFVGQANQLVNSSLNIGSIASTFGPITGGMDNLITGSFSQVTQAFGSFGGDLANLGSLIDTSNLSNLGNPSALVGQLAKVGGMVPGVESALRTAGLDTSQIASIAGGALPNLTGTANKTLYDAMTNITGTDLAQVKSILNVSTPGIGNMADLLNPQKILPNSFQTLTTPTPDGLRGVYTAAGQVNSNLERVFQDPSAPPYTGDDPIVRARLGLPPVSDADRTITV